MRRTAVFLGVTLAVGIAVGVIGIRVLSATQGPVKRAVLLETDLAGMEGKEGFVILAEIAPGRRRGNTRTLGTSSSIFSRTLRSWKRKRGRRSR